MPLQPALTNGSVKPHRPILKWSIIALLAIWALVIIRAELGAGSGSHSHAKPAAASSSTAPPANPTANTVTGAATGSPEQMITAAVSSFIPAWLTPGTPDQRQAALAPSTAPDLLAQLINVPADALPQAQLAGTPQINSADPTTAIATATLTDDTFIAMRLQLNPSGNGTWLVTDIDTPAGPSAPSTTTVPIATPPAVATPPTTAPPPAAPPVQ